MKRLLVRRFTHIFIIIIINLLILEVFSFIILQFKGDFRYKPLYSFKRINYRTHPTSVDNNPYFGVWHIPNSKSRYVERCFDVQYSFNSYGARDKGREKYSLNKRVVVLGDSFVEGFGVDAKKRFTDILEVETGTAHLNFGASGSFGSTQALLLYKNMAKEFTHSAVLIGLFPANDFHDDSYEYGKNNYVDRYRPYLTGQYPDYDLVYFQNDLHDSSFTAEEFYNNAAKEAKKLNLDKRNPKFILQKFSSFYNALRLVRDSIYLSPPHSNSYSGYYDFNEEGLLKLKFALENIAQEAQGKKIYVFTIPALADFLRYKKENQPPLSVQLERLGQSIGFEYVDLLPLMASQTKNIKKYYLDCDGHWNEQGHKLAAQILMKKFSLYSN